ncbi:COX15/CtaA family protein [Actinomadura oligospora]|uniref:COX15/CtaA family protein n=1 Tax=Actinomadura oligospora TaxID=111804 RepID=UPI00047AAA47|nr:COX15/CtaA family protein [Actinomadura oligospora]
MAERSQTAAAPRPADPRRSRNPLTRVIDSFWNPTPASLRLLALLGVIGNALIVATGGAVRVTKSGLGCPDWPRCSGDSLVPTHNPAHSAANMAIEFGNRMLTFVVLAIGVLVFVAALRLVPRRKDLVWWALAQPMSVVAQAVIGGIVVLSKLHPAAVALHFLISPALLVFCVALYERSGEGDTAPERIVRPVLRGLSAVLASAAAVVLVAGTVVTGTGPHAGDDKSRRWGFEIEDVTRVHSGLAWITVGLTVLALIVAFRTGAPAAYRRRVLTLVAIEVAQGALGYIQYFMGVPGPLVVLHMLGAVLLWITALRILFATRDRGSMPAAETAAPAPSSRTEPQPA